jgi:hypothetical protein
MYRGWTPYSPAFRDKALAESPQDKMQIKTGQNLDITWYKENGAANGSMI